MLIALIKKISIKYYINLQSLKLKIFLIFTNLIVLICPVILRLVVLLAGLILRKKFSQDRESSRAFECGFDSASQGLLPFRLRFFLLANIFLIFDVELILLFPFLVKVTTIVKLPGILLFSVFLTLLAIGLFHEWNQKILEWVS